MAELVDALENGAESARCALMMIPRRGLSESGLGRAGQSPPLRRIVAKAPATLAVPRALVAELVDALG